MPRPIPPPSLPCSQPPISHPPPPVPPRVPALKNASSYPLFSSDPVDHTRSAGWRAARPPFPPAPALPAAGEPEAEGEPLAAATAAGPLVLAAETAWETNRGRQAASKQVCAAVARSQATGPGAYQSVAVLLVSTVGQLSPARPAHCGRGQSCQYRAPSPTGISVPMRLTHRPRQPIPPALGPTHPRRAVELQQSCCLP